MEETPELPASPAAEKPKTFTVLVILLFCVSMLSWLLIYAGTNALIAADMMKPWPAKADPRLEWWGISIVVILALVLVGGRIVPWIITRQASAIDAIADAEDTEPDAVAALAGRSQPSQEPSTPKAGS